MMQSFLKWNAEFAKNLWLELSVQRLIAMPAIIIVVALLIMMNTGEEANQVLHYSSLAGFVFVGMIWGIKSSADAILDEYNEKTWDWQRMSVIGAWKLGIGKLFGSTIYNWYGALLFWAIYVLTSLTMDDPAKELKISALLIIGMISLHGLMILISLLMIRKADGKSKIKSTRIIIPGFIIVIYLSNVFRGSFFGEISDFSWYGLVYDPLWISIVSSVFLCFWVVAGLYRSMRAELQFSDTPGWWVTFLLTSFLFQYGYFAGAKDITVISGITMSLMVLFAQCLALVYFLSFSESKDVVNFRLLFNSIKAGRYKVFLQNAPLWLITLPVAFIAGILSDIFLKIAYQDSFTGEIMRDFGIHGSGRATMLLIAIFGFVVRDIGILLLLNFSSRSKRADSAMVVYLLFLYVLMPLLLKDLGVGAAFYPDISANPIVMAVLPVIEAAIVVFFLFRKWGRLEAQSAG